MRRLCDAAGGAQERGRRGAAPGIGRAWRRYGIGVSMGSALREDHVHWLRRQQTAVMAAALVAATWSNRVAAEGALAVGLPADVAKEGFAFGFALDKSSAEEACAAA